MKPGPCRLGLMALALLLGGCSTTARVAYAGRHLAAPIQVPGRTLAGRALVVMSAEEAGWVYEGPPVGDIAVTEWTQFAVGEITRQAALTIAGAAFADGAEYRPAAAGVPIGAVVIRPKVNQFTYQWSQEEFMAWSHVPVIEMEEWIEIRDAGGRILFDRTYGSGRVVGRIKGLASAKRRNDELARVFHVAVAQLLARAMEEYAGTVPAAAGR